MSLFINWYALTAKIDLSGDSVRISTLWNFITSIWYVWLVIVTFEGFFVANTIYDVDKTNKCIWKFNPTSLVKDKSYEFVS